MLRRDEKLENGRDALMTLGISRLYDDKSVTTTNILLAFINTFSINILFSWSSIKTLVRRIEKKSSISWVVLCMRCAKDILPYQQRKAPPLGIDHHEDRICCET